MTVSVRNAAARSVRPPTAGLLAQLAVLTMLAAGVGLGVAGWLAGTGYAVVTWALLSWALQRPGADSWGPANTVTLARATLVGGVAALAADSLWEQTSVVVLVSLATVALLLDAVDGQVARRTGTTSPLGARFDVEADSFLLLALSVFVAGYLGWWVVAIGAIRYAFVVAGWGLPWLRAPLPVRRSGKTVAAVQGVVLVVASAGVLPRPVATATVGLALALLGVSFGRSIGWLWRRRDAVRRRHAVDVARVGGVRQRQDVRGHLRPGDPPVEGQRPALAQRNVEAGRPE